MSQKRLIQTKALNAYLKSRHTSLPVAIMRIGLSQEHIQGETISEDVAGRIARLHALTPEKLSELVAPYVTA